MAAATEEVGHEVEKSGVEEEKAPEAEEEEEEEEEAQEEAEVEAEVEAEAVKAAEGPGELQKEKTPPEHARSALSRPVGPIAGPASTMNTAVAPSKAAPATPVRVGASIGSRAPAPAPAPAAPAPVRSASAAAPSVSPTPAAWEAEEGGGSEDGAGGGGDGGDGLLAVPGEARLSRRRAVDLHSEEVQQPRAVNGATEIAPRSRGDHNVITPPSRPPRLTQCSSTLASPRRSRSSSTRNRRRCPPSVFASRAGARRCHQLATWATAAFSLFRCCAGGRRDSTRRRASGRRRRRSGRRRQQRGRRRPAVFWMTSAQCCARRHAHPTSHPRTK